MTWLLSARIDDEGPVVRDDLLAERKAKRQQHRRAERARQEQQRQRRQHSARPLTAIR